MFLITNKTKIINKLNNFIKKLSLFILFGIRVIKILIINNYTLGLIK